MKYTMTADGVTVVHLGATYNVAREAPNFARLAQFLRAGEWSDAVACLTTGGALKVWSSGHFTATPDGASVTYNGRPVPDTLAKRILEAVARDESPARFLRFYERLSRNPSWRSVNQLFDFLQHCGISITPSGMIVAYKGVNQNYTDCHTGRVDNRPGARPRMDRNQISDDPDKACHVGYHVGSYQYAVGFGPRVVVCVVDPENVVCVPKDAGWQKMRVCAYAVVGHYGEPLPDSVDEPTVPPEPSPSDDPEADEADKYGPLPTLEEIMAMGINALRSQAAAAGIVGANRMTAIVIARALLRRAKGAARRCST